MKFQSSLKFIPLLLAGWMTSSAQLMQHNWTYLYGDERSTNLNGITVDGNNNVFITGNTSNQNNIATPGTFQPDKNLNEIPIGNGVSIAADAFAAKVTKDKQLEWGTYYGGDLLDGFNAVAVHGDHIYAGGFTESKEDRLTTSGAHQRTNQGFDDALLAKFDKDGKRIWGTFFGGPGFDQIYDLKVDANENVIAVLRIQNSFDLATEGADQTVYGGGIEDFLLAKFDKDGKLKWATYVGGNNAEISGQVAVDPEGSIYVTGSTHSDQGISTSGAHQPNLNGVQDAFLVKYNSSGQKQWATYFGGSNTDQGFAVEADNQQVYITGKTSSYDLTVKNAHQSEFAGLVSDKPNDRGNRNDGFIAAFNNQNGQLNWATYYGGETGDDVWDMGVNENYLVISGVTRSEQGISHKGFQNEKAAIRDAYLAVFTKDGNLHSASYLGGSKSEKTAYVVIGADNVAYLVGNSVDNEFPGTEPPYPERNSYYVFIAQIKILNPPTLNINSLVSSQPTLQSINGWVRLPSGWGTQGLVLRNLQGQKHPFSMVSTSNSIKLPGKGLYLLEGGGKSSRQSLPVRW